MIFEHTPTVIGHRGAGKGRTENTLPAILAAIAAGLSWVEIDVTRTADDGLVLRHDPTTADGAFLVDVPAAGSGLLRLEELFAELPPEVAVDVDVKTVLEDAVDAPSRRTGALLLPLLRREARRRPLLVTSFDPSLLLHLRDELPEVPLGLLTWLRFPLWHAVPAAAGLGLQAVAVHTGSCGLDHPDTRLRPLEQCVDMTHKAGLEFVAWCPSAERAPDYAAAGVDAMVVDDVPGVVAALA
ncbi:MULTISPECIES: glycerophosphodiester phosphodiesterase [Thermomonosporaceae]|uniref:glycerophosphodiester phosphodiesterase n=1 Tax=Thermomonosporaceae TaxID=2012 RepID=UPI00255AC79C|nr:MULTISPECIES: glycerophosphodiester phosphodiesterase [Thermomonosporaceae]MDL4776077.1 glycerophosphodiester phosphodiesterase [Actinomadura xylanilytica]